MLYLPRLSEEDPFAHLREIKQPTFILNGVNDVMIATVNSFIPSSCCAKAKSQDKAGRQRKPLERR